MSRWTALALLGVLTGCALEDPDPMTDQEKYQAYGESPLFDDTRTMRTPPAGTVPRKRLLERVGPLSGRTADGFVEEIPIRITPELLERGRTRFEVYCATCHGLLGDGDSMVARNMALRPPPSLHPYAANYPVGYIYTVITEGYGLMPAYDEKIDPPERWAVVAYLQALHRSQYASLSDAPEDVRQSLLRELAP